jgi:hypothetical protein
VLPEELSGAPRGRGLAALPEHITNSKIRSTGIGIAARRGEEVVIPSIVVFGLLAIGLVLVIYGTVAKNRWGINFGAVSCPCCNLALPQVRKPKSFRQAMWGGYTCQNCRAEVDKWGRQINK